MQLLILIMLVALSKARATDDGTENQDGVIINGINFRKQILKDNLYLPYQLALDYDANILYFSFIPDGSNSFITALILLKTKEFGTVYGVRGGVGNAVDPKTHKNYIGSSDGIYVLNQNTQTAVKTNITNLKVWQVFVQDDIYFTTDPEEEAYVYKNGETKRVSEIGDNKAILVAADKNHDIYYYNYTGLFHYNKDDGKTEVLGNHKVVGFALDANDNILFSTKIGIYVIKDKRVIKLVSFDNIYGGVIAADGSIIYATNNSIVRLKSPKNCNGVIINGFNHETQILKDNLYLPYQLALDYDTNTLYFSFIPDGSNSFIPALINLDTKEFRTVYGVRGGVGNAVDPKTHTKYIGSSDGIYVLNQNTQTAVKTNITNLKVWQVFVQDDIYFTSDPEEEAYVYKNGETKRVSEIGDNKAILVAVDKNHDIYYYNYNGLFHYNKDDGTTEVPGNHKVAGFALDANGNILFSTKIGIYVIKNRRVMKLVSFDNIYGGVIAADGSIIYATNNSIVRLKSTGDECSKESLESYRSSLYKGY